jgi:hypothetical protein
MRKDIDYLQGLTKLSGHFMPNQTFSYLCHFSRGVFTVMEEQRDWALSDAL